MRSLRHTNTALSSILTAVILMLTVSLAAGAVDIPKQICSSGAVKNNSVSLYINGSVGQPVIQKCNSVSLYLKSGFFQAYSTISRGSCQPGDANNDGALNILDVVYLINYKYKDGPVPVPETICSGDADCDCKVNILDVVLLIDYKYKFGLPPCGYTNWRTACE